jgi:predicted aspartyl protease
MGETYADVTLISNGNRAVKHLLVDTGASYTWIAATTLKRLGIRPTGTRRFSMINGRSVVRRIADVEVQILGERVHTVVVCAGPREAEVLGLHALEGLALEVNPANRTLRRAKSLKAL